MKFRDGGWVPIVAALGVFTLMTTWKRGREALADDAPRRSGLPLDVFIADLHRKDVPRVPGTAVFMTSNVGTVPPVLLHHLKHNKVLHERVLLVSLLERGDPVRARCAAGHDRDLGRGLLPGAGPLRLHGDALRSLRSWSHWRGAPPRPDPGSTVLPMETTFYLGRETLLPIGPARIATWRKRLFIVMARNAQTASSFFGLPPNRVVEMGAQIEL